MTSTGGSNLAGLSETPCPWLSLTLEEQLSNFKRTFLYHYSSSSLGKEHGLELASQIVKKLRENLWVDTRSMYRGLVKMLRGATPLHWAVLLDDRTMVRYILNSGKVDINAKSEADCRETTALIFAMNCGLNVDIVADLLSHNADISICDSHGNSALFYMVHRKDSLFRILKMVLANNVDVFDSRKITTLHHAAKKGALNVVTYLLSHNADVNSQDYRGRSVLCSSLEHSAKLTGYPVSHPYRTAPIEVSQKLLTSGANVHFIGEGGNNALHFAVRAYDLKCSGTIDIIKHLRGAEVDINAKNTEGYSPFFAAVAEGHTEVVQELLKSKAEIRLMDECHGETAIQVADDNGHEQIKRALLECEDVSRYVGDLYRDRQVYVDAANAILVGAALIASVTFASWLQPPLGYTTPFVKDPDSNFDLAPASPNSVDYVDVQHDVSMRAFWVFNSLSFYFAMATVVFGARSVLPRRQSFIKGIVQKLHWNLLVTSFLLACSVLFVMVAFGIAGCIVLTPMLKFQWYMIVPTLFGGLVCLISLALLFKSMLEDSLGSTKKKKYRLYGKF